MTIEFATQADIPAIMAIERTPGFEGFIGRWSEEQHAGEMAKASTRYLVHRDGGEVKAFAIFQHIGDPDCRVHLKRAASSETGQGIGSALLRQAPRLALHGDRHQPRRPRSVRRERASPPHLRKARLRRRRPDARLSPSPSTAASATRLS